MIENFPFVLSVSKHSEPFFSILIEDYPRAMKPQGTST
jgi:hypothetical protein